MQTKQNEISAEKTEAQDKVNATKNDFRLRKFDINNYIISCFFLLWLGLFLARIFVLQNPIIISKIAADAEFIVHFFILFLLFKNYKNISLKLNAQDKSIFIWFIITNIGLLLDDISWYLISYLNSDNPTDVSTIPFLLDQIPFFTWIIASIICTYKILNNYVLQLKRRYKTVALFLAANLAIISLFLSAIHYANGFFALETITQITTFVAQIIVYDFVILCLIYCEHKGLKLFLIGIIILIAGDFFLVYSDISKTLILASYGELLWFLGLLFNWLGIIEIKKQNNYTISTWVKKDNVIKGKLAFWCFIVGIASFLLFFVIAYIFHLISEKVFLGLPLFIMLHSIIIVVFSLYVGQYFEIPFKKLTSNINILMTGNKAQIDNSFSTEEFIFLQNYILKAFEYKEEVKTLELENKNNLLLEQEKFRQVVRQLGHDLAAPISSLNNMMNRLASVIPENERVTLRNAAERITGISQKLMSQYNPDSNDGTEVFLASLALMQIVSERREDYRETGTIIEINIDKDAQFSCINHNIGIFKRMISNLVKNAVEAVAMNTEMGVVTVNLNTHLDKVIIVIQDNGHGIPQHIQEKFQQGIEVTEGKECGHGVGLTQVKDAITLGNGSSSITADQDGTIFTIIFPLVSIPPWVATEIKLTPEDTVIILDDDDSIHGSWNSNFKEILENHPSIKVLHFSHGLKVIEHINALTLTEQQNIFLLTDFELLGQRINGLDVIRETNLRRAILVTSYSTDADRQKEVTRLQIKILPKELAAAAKIKVAHKSSKPTKVVDMVWVEDQKWYVDGLIASYYSHLAVDVYYDPVSFMENIQQYPLDTKIILDTYYETADGTQHYEKNGYDLAKELHELGYTKLILYTGEAPNGDAPEYLHIVHKAELGAEANMANI